MKLSLWVASAALAGFCAPALGGLIVFFFDYSLDAGGIFDGSTASGKQAQAAMDRAAQVFSDRLVDRLSAIAPTSGDTWSPRIVNPGTGADMAAPISSLTANVIKVYVGSRSLAVTEVGNTVIGYGTASGSQAFMDSVQARGQAGALANPKMDFGPWGGSIAFDDSTNWYFGATAGGLTAQKMDFQSVAIHELEHLLGFSVSQASWLNLVVGGKFTGVKTVAANGGIAPTVTGSHWLGMSSAVGLGGPSQVALMDASLPLGTRRKITQLDWAALDDAGWEFAIPGDANADGVVDFLDFQAIESGFGETNSRWAHGDFNEDGIVDSADLALLFKNYGKHSDGSASPIGASEEQALAAFAAEVGVPEPGTAGLLFSIAIFAVSKRRR